MWSSSSAIALLLLFQSALVLGLERGEQSRLLSSSETSDQTLPKEHRHLVGHGVGQSSHNLVEPMKPAEAGLNEESGQLAGDVDQRSRALWSSWWTNNRWDIGEKGKGGDGDNNPKSKCMSNIWNRGKGKGYYYSSKSAKYSSKKGPKSSKSKSAKSKSKKSKGCDVKPPHRPTKPTRPTPNRPSPNRPTTPNRPTPNRPTPNRPTPNTMAPTAMVNTMAPTNRRTRRTRVR